jgi:SAM-dependent methyltransferase
MQSLLKDTFRKDDRSFWFNRIYHDYKTRLKPETDFQQLQVMINGARLLDYGCGSGYLSARLARGGYQVVATDVLDYRYEEAKQLPFIQMASPTDISYPGGDIDTALVQAVLHHIDPPDLPLVIQRLAQVAKHVLIKEDTYDLPGGLPSLAETQACQPLLRQFKGLPRTTQFQSLVLIDFFANAIAQGIPEMNMPFEFKPVAEWVQVLEANGLNVTQTRLTGFEPGRMHKSCHVWFSCDSCGMRSTNTPPNV